MASPAKPSSLASMLMLVLLAFAALSHSRPILESSGPRSLHARSPDPRMIPSTGNLLNDIFKSVGLESLANLNHWKEETHKNSTITDEKSKDNVNYATDHSQKQTNSNQLSNPANDPAGFVSNLIDLLADKWKQAMDSDDERTLY
ncbi:hypothetical protein BBP40_010129 [Aspergillus hancockii]|nr:hypothetical protein BBP40_010129 [Aspergillus hancockii]